MNIQKKNIINNDDYYFTIDFNMSSLLCDKDSNKYISKKEKNQMHQRIQDRIRNLDSTLFL